MKASYIERFGGPEVLKFGELPDPTARNGEVIIDIHAASVNGADWKVRSNRYNQELVFPYILGRDFSGTISTLGGGVEDFSVGDEVFGVCDVGQEGSYAEKISMKADIIAHKPATLSYIDAASVALVGLTALISIEQSLKLKSGEKILIQGGAGGVASFAVQVAKHIGAHVVTTASVGNHEYLSKLGADEIIDYNTQDFEQTVSNCDAVFDTVGGDVALKSFEVLKPGGRAAFIASGVAAPASPRSDVTALRPSVGRDRQHLNRIVELIDSGAIKLPETKLFALSEAAEAHRISEARHLRGKLVFKMQ